MIWWASWCGHTQDTCTLSRPSEKSISMVSFRMGSRPPWWIPIPLFNSGSTCSTWGPPRGWTSRLLFWAFISWSFGNSASSSVHRIAAIITRERGIGKAWNPRSGKVWFMVGFAAACTVAVYPLTTITSTWLVFIMWLNKASWNNSSTVFEPLLILCVQLFTLRLFKCRLVEND